MAPCEYSALRESSAVVQTNSVADGSGLGPGADHALCDFHGVCASVLNNSASGFCFFRLDCGLRQDQRVLFAFVSFRTSKGEHSADFRGVDP